MKTPEQKSKYCGAGFVLRAALLLFGVVCCLGMACSFTHAWFVTERGVNENQVELATYGVTVYDAEDNELVGSEYLCPLAPEDLHYFTLKAEGTAYTGHCLVEVTPPASDSELESDSEAESYVIELAPDRSGMVGLQAAEGSLLNFSFDWGTGENPVEPASAFGREDFLLFSIEHSRTPYVDYEVAYGASLAGIANYYNISMEDLCAYNALDIDFKGSLAGEVLAIPYVESHPEGGPYVPKGDLVIAIENAGDAVTPDNTYFIVTGPDGYETWIWYEDFKQGSYLLEDLTAGEYELSMIAAERELYTLETNGDMSALVTENCETECVIENTYTRHKGDLIIWMDVYGHEIPEDAVVILSGPEDTYEIPYNSFDEDYFLQENLPTGEYTVMLTGAEVDDYTLTADEKVVIVEQGEVIYALLAADYERHVGDLKICVEADGHDIPENAVVVLNGPEDTYEIPYELFDDGSFRVEDLPTGEYTVKLKDAGVDNYTLTVYKDTVEVERDETVEAELVAKYERHVGNMEILIETEGHEIPEDAVVVLYGPEDTYKISYARFKNDAYYVENLPTGEYNVKLEDAGVEGYTLNVQWDTVDVEKDEGAEAELAVMYVRDVGILEIIVQVRGASLPDDAWLEISGPDGFEDDIACESCTLTDLPTGEYSIYVEEVNLDGYNAVVKDCVVSVTKKGAKAQVSITYTAIEAAHEEDSLCEENVPAE